MDFNMNQIIDNEAQIKVFGIGGGGCNAINRLVDEKLKNIELIAVNTDNKVLRTNKSHIKITIGGDISKGLGAGGDPDIGMKSAVESEEDIKGVIKGSDMIFIMAGMGGGTGTGASPIIAKIARENFNDILIVGVVTKPFLFEGLEKMEKAEKGLEEMRKYCDSLIVIPNEKIFEIIPKDTPMDEAFKKVDDVLSCAIKGITDIINSGGLINVDFADIKTAMKNSGTALIGIGKGEGTNRHINAVKEALTSPFLENSDINDAKTIILNMTGSKEKFLAGEYEEINDYVRKSVSNENIKIKPGIVYDENMGNSIQVTIIVTGFSNNKNIAVGVNYTSVKKIPVGITKDIEKSFSSNDFEKPAYLRVHKKILD